MARLTKAKGKLVRRYGVNIFGNEKYDRLLKRRPNPPGEMRQRRPRQTEFARQLREKQKLKFAYGVTERQLRRIYARAKTMPGVTGDNMLFLLERRLDNVVYRLGMAASRAQARQLVSHGHFYFNGRKITVPSLQVRVGDEVKVRDKKESVHLLRRLVSENGGRPVPEWMENDELTGRITMLPTREMVLAHAEVHRIVEFFSK